MGIIQTCRKWYTFPVRRTKPKNSNGEESVMSDTEFAKRLEKLERDNRRLKAIAFAVIILAAALCGIYATQPVPEEIMAHRFDLVDNSGTVRASMNVGTSGMSAVTVYNADGRPGAVMVTSTSGGSVVGAYSPDGKSHALMGAPASGGSEFGLSDASGSPRLGMNVSPSGDPVIKLSDEYGYIMGLGSMSTVMPGKGERLQSSAASIVMFGNDKKHHVIWKAP